MGRYQVDVDGKPHLRRLRVVQTPWFAILLTRILTPDAERDPHNHSRGFVSLILRGGYLEQAWPIAAQPKSTWRYHNRFSLMGLRQCSAHRIDDVKPGTVTLVLAGRHRGTWAFWTPDGPVDWKDYG